ncbi:MAG: pseudouridylate synthase [Sphingobacteriales bacterium]|nr:MAG: pseudouridylate synthase [Sphingobacteriales bacterium]
MLLEILYQDEYMVAINKPHNLLVHQSSIARDATEFALQILRDQISQWVSPVHRLDRKTAGVLLFALDKETEKLMNQQFANGLISKKYLAIVRGFTADEQDIDYPLRKENGTLQDAFTSYKTLARTQINLAFGNNPTSRYSLVQAKPTTGRMHQLRKHFAHIHHPIIGDRPHGCNKQNKLFKDKWAMDTMMLHAAEIAYTHPITQQNLVITAQLSDEFIRVLEFLEFGDINI